MTKSFLSRLLYASAIISLIVLFSKYSHYSFLDAEIFDLFDDDHFYDIGEHILPHLFRLMSINEERSTSSRFNSNSNGNSKSDSVAPIVDIVITVKTTVLVLQNCINSLLRNKPNQNVLIQRIILVDDGSPIDSLQYQTNLCSTSRDILCTETSTKERGYTHAVNKGIAYCESRGHQPSEAIVLLNSDTIVTTGWLTGLYTRLMDSPKTMIVGPLSNAASYQSVPLLQERKNDKKKKVVDWATNSLLPGMNIDSLAREIRQYSNAKAIPDIRMDILNGFCFMFRRSVVSAVGLFDTTHFPGGYGEEVDFSIRVNNSGFSLVVVPTVYVYHQKTASFTNSQKVKLKKQSRNYLDETYGKQLFANFNKQAIQIQHLMELRNFVQTVYDRYKKKYTFLPKVTMLFVVHDVVLAGGIVSVLQEATEMVNLGINASVSIPAKAIERNGMNKIYSMLPYTPKELVDKIVIPHQGGTMHPQPISKHFLEIASNFDIVIGTYCKTMGSVLKAAESNRKLLPAYYVQDYETWFWHSPWFRDSKQKHIAYANKTYTAMTGRMYMFAKTKWTRDMVHSQQNREVAAVIPSLDHWTYYPNNTDIALKVLKTSGQSVFRVIAMIRPSTPRRNPAKTLDLMLKLAYDNPKGVKIALFGCETSELMVVHDQLSTLFGEAPYRNRNFFENNAQIEVLGQISHRNDLADLFRHSDVFIDMSWWQAFGRTALEAMTCGCIAVMPAVGAANEMCGNSESCLYHDGNDVKGYYEKVKSILTNDKLRAKLIRRGLEITNDFTIEGAAASIASNLHQALKKYRDRLA